LKSIVIEEIVAKMKRCTASTAYVTMTDAMLTPVAHFPGSEIMRPICSDAKQTAIGRHRYPKVPKKMEIIVGTARGSFWFSEKWKAAHPMNAYATEKKPENARRK
jgi:hypothetical protein